MTVDVFDRQGDAPVPPDGVRHPPGGARAEGGPARATAGHDHDHGHGQGNGHDHAHGHDHGQGHDHRQPLGEAIASIGGPLGTLRALPGGLGLGGGETRTVRIAPSLLRFGLGQRLAIAAVTVAALWGATLAVIG
ncbi:hypothetical protein [Mongoliimonas terrestris]|uniref:hypothetical protein n=1 Tax=Mongoliimonas terrestris TaxID=1709001 RepID=UPI000B281BEF|nr:hypothetical protein [Mongoliimonas terrestris]